MLMSFLVSTNITSIKVTVDWIGEAYIKEFVREHSKILQRGIEVESRRKKLRAAVLRLRLSIGCQMFHGSQSIL